MKAQPHSLSIFTMHTDSIPPLDPQAEVNQSAMIMSFINQAAPDIRKKLYKQEGLGEMTIWDLMKVAERVFNT
jgi:hypothetical protein